MSLRNIFYKLAHDVSRYPNIVQLINTLDHGFKEVAEHIQDGGSEVEVTPVYTSGEKLATITVNDVDNDIYMPNGEVKTMEGSSFKTVNGSLVDEMKVGFTPIQSLNGYSKPWAGGAGKNKLDFSSVVGTDNSVTFSIADDGGIALTGTASANIYRFCNSNFVLTPGTSYTISGMTASVRMRVREFDSSNNVLHETYANNIDVTFTVDANTVKLDSCIVISSGYATSGEIYPMIRLASISDPTFEPYSNICPISGHTQVQSKINNTTYTTSLGATYYGGEAEQVGGTGNSEYANIASYNGESITEPWLSSLDEYIPNATPTTGAQVCYKLAAPVALTLTGQNITAEAGVNAVSAPGTNQTIEEVKYHQMMTIQDVEKLIQ